MVTQPPPPSDLLAPQRPVERAVLEDFYQGMDERAEFLTEEKSKWKRESDQALVLKEKVFAPPPPVMEVPPWGKGGDRLLPHRQHRVYAGRRRGARL